MAHDLARWSIRNGYTLDSVTGISRTEVSSYDYDEMGNRTYEHHTSTRKFTSNTSMSFMGSYGSSSTKYDNSTFVYDFKRTINSKYNARGQLVEVTSPQQGYSPQVLEAATSKYGSSSSAPIAQTSGLETLRYSYDEVGNRRRVYSEVLKSTTHGTKEVKDHYYTYDAVNRVIMANATSSGGFQEGTRKFVYDKLDRRTREIFYDGSRYDHEEYTYLYSSGLLSHTYRVDNSTSSSTAVTTYRQSSRYYNSSDGRLDSEYRYATYDKEGNSHASRGDTIGRTVYFWNSSNGQLSQQTNYTLKDIYRNEARSEYGGTTYYVKVYDHSALRASSEVKYTNYNNAGHNTEYSVEVYKNDLLVGQGDSVDYTEEHTKTYRFGSSVQQASSSMETNRRHWTPNNTTSYYDRFGELLYVRGSNTRSEGHDRMLISNREGQVLFRRDGKCVQDYYYVNGKVLGESGTLSGTNFESHIVNTSAMQQVTPGTYAVTDGDTLHSIAQKLWGDASLWYVLADANAIAPNATLKQGMSLTIPTVNSNVHNNDETFKPYNAADAIGKIDAEAVYVPPPSPNNCAQVIVAVVVIVVATIVTYGAGTALAAGATGASATAAGVAAAGIGAAVGNVAGQLVGIALGVQDGFDLGAVIKSGFRGALAAGVGAVAGDVGSFVGENYATTVGEIAARSAVQAGGNYLINRTLEGQSFSWKAFAANMAGSMAGHAIFGEAQTPSQAFAKDFASSFLGGYTESRARVWMGIGGSQGFENIAVDAFGNAVGNSVVRAHRAGAEKAIERQQISPINKAWLTAGADARAPISPLNSGWLTAGADARGPISPLNSGWLTAGADARTPSTIVSPLSAADHPSNWNWDEEDLLFAEREAALANNFENLNKGQSIGGSWAWSGQCTIDNPYGLSQAQAESGITLAFGGSISADAGKGVSVETGRFISINMSKKTITFGDYASAQGGASFGVPGPGASAVVTYFESPEFSSVMDGMYSSHGVHGAFGTRLEAGAVISYTNTGPISGLQLGLGGGAPSFGIHNHVGYGNIIDTSVETIKFSDIPKELFLHAIGYKQHEKTQQLLKNYINNSN